MQKYMHAQAKSNSKRLYMRADIKVKKGFCMHKYMGRHREAQISGHSVACLTTVFRGLVLHWAVCTVQCSYQCALFFENEIQS